MSLSFAVIIFTLGKLNFITLFVKFFRSLNNDEACATGEKIQEKLTLTNVKSIIYVCSFYRCL